MGKRFRYFTKDNIRWQKSIWKDATSLVNRKRQIKTTIRYHCISIRMAKTKTAGVGGAGVEKRKGKERKKRKKNYNTKYR